MTYRNVLCILLACLMHTYALAAEQRQSASVLSGDAPPFGGWYEVSKLLAGDGAAGDRLGSSVAISGDYALVGAHGNDDNGTDAGSAYTYQLNQMADALVLPDVTAMSSTYLSVPITLTFANVLAADLAFTFDPTIMTFDHVGYHAFQDQPDAQVEANVTDGNVLRISLAAGGMQNPVTLDGGVLVEAVFWVSADAPEGVVAPLSWRPFQETNVNEVEVPTTNGSVLVQHALYGDVTGDGEVTALDASHILQYVVGIADLVNEAVADVTSNGFISSYDAALVLRKVVFPDFLFPVETGQTARAAQTLPRLLSWVREGPAWCLRVNDPTGVTGAEFVFTMPSAASVGVEGAEYLAFHQEESTLRVAFARQETTEPALLRLTGEALESDPPVLTAVEFNEGQIPVVSTRPLRFALGQNAPNPFNPTTTIRFTVPARGTVNMAVYDVSGRHVRTLVSGSLEVGVHEITWDGRDEVGRSLASGVYLYRLTYTAASPQNSPTNASAASVRRMVLVR